MTHYGYARVSTDKQELQDQIDRVVSQGADAHFTRVELDLLREEVLDDWSYAQELEYEELLPSCQDHIRNLPENRELPETWLNAAPSGEYWAYESLTLAGRARVDVEVSRRLGDAR